MPQVALTELDKIAADSRLAEYQPYWAVRAELLTKLKKGIEAREAYQIAIGIGARSGGAAILAAAAGSVSGVARQNARSSLRAPGWSGAHPSPGGYFARI